MTAPFDETWIVYDTGSGFVDIMGYPAASPGLMTHHFSSVFGSDDPAVVAAGALCAAAPDLYRALVAVMAAVAPLEAIPMVNEKIPAFAAARAALRKAEGGL